jgi:O-antigen ligase
MAAQRPWTGFGPETFSVEFPKFQSLDLARAYPDFYHESPHNVFLDALTAQGASGLVALLAFAIFGFYASTRLGREQRAPLVAGWAGLLVCHLFVVFIAPTAAYFYLWLAMLALCIVAFVRQLRRVLGLRGAFRRLQRDVGLRRRLGCLHDRASCALARHSRSPCA